MQCQFVAGGKPGKLLVAMPARPFSPVKFSGLIERDWNPIKAQRPAKKKTPFFMELSRDQCNGGFLREANRIVKGHFQGLGEWAQIRF
jgi:hypothetical protein